jgi:hypothetical protein
MRIEEFRCGSGGGGGGGGGAELQLRRGDGWELKLRAEDATVEGEGEEEGAARAIVRAAFDAKRAAVGVGARMLFYPTLAYNVVRNQFEPHFHWWDQVDEVGDFFTSFDFRSFRSEDLLTYLSCVDCCSFCVHGVSLGDSRCNVASSSGYRPFFVFFRARSLNRRVACNPFI